ncbi:aminopeptidase P family protein [Mucilaginibacter sp. Bleaf8]|uniref:aminopeptidase P family protein n=1 Tax=Mucilaginibacter sp. Bleaf8 TaxID=2834430 RepID=UPI001BCCC1B3|nr:aminopeptidase P family protein [Mucilaginibacter sp. Bleaf8]MBS7563889.1 aminopeptidase P family protein [Mucilaginibacter sp. Bleaf8]
MTYKEKLEAIRAQMKAHGVDAYIIPSADPHISEYVPDHYKCLHFASGFTGSAGTLVITHDFAGLWTDARYFVQAAEQLQDTGYELMKLKVQHTPEYIDWLHEVMADNAVIACDDRMLSVMLGELLEKQLADKNIQLKSYDFLNDIWANRPPLPAEKAFLINDKYTGEATTAKLNRLRAALKNYRANYHLVSSLDDIAWLFNIRGKDVSYNPVVLSFALVSQTDATLFITPDKLSEQDEQLLQQQGVTLLPYEAIDKALASIPQNSSILIDPKRNCFGLYKLLPKGVHILQDINPSTNFKAVKNQIEIESMRATMLKDGVAMTRFMKWIEDNISKTPITELSAAEVLQNFRAEQEGFSGISFNTISAYKEHGALPHYAATPESNSEVKPESLFLVDSGGQYFYGTTDITRVIPMGNATAEERADYSLVLKAMIEGSITRFPKGTRGYQIDAICRKPLWDYAINYGHGTGHGIGFYLNVHEGPQVLNPTNAPVALELGMITSIEPGVYRPGKHGIRIENLVLTVQDQVSEFEEFYAFETLTLAFIDTSLVEKDLLEQRHINWLNQYHQTVYEKLSPYLTAEESGWLKEKTTAI